MTISRIAVLYGLTLCLGTPLRAEVDLPALEACLEKQVAANGPALACVQAEHSECGNYPLDKAPDAAMLCYVTAQDAWTAATRARLDIIRSAGNDRIAAIAGIEVKYDTLAGLLQCDRQEELALLSEATSNQINVQKARCTATVMALSYAKLLLQSRVLE